MESTTTIDLTDATAPTQETSIDEIHIETTEERLFSVEFYRKMHKTPNQLQSQCVTKFVRSQWHSAINFNKTQL